MKITRVHAGDVIEKTDEPVLYYCKNAGVRIINLSTTKVHFDSNPHAFAFAFVIACTNLQEDEYFKVRNYNSPAEIRVCFHSYGGIYDER